MTPRRSGMDLASPRHAVRVLFVVAVAASLAGCLQPPPTQARSDDLLVSVAGDGAFLVAVPLPLDALWDLQDWQDVIDAKAVSAGNASVSIGPTDRGPALWIDGDGFVSIELRRRAHPDCCADSFTDGTWSLPSGGRPLATLPAFVAEGTVESLRVDYEASSCQGPDCRRNDPDGNQYCSLQFAARASSPVVGWNDVPVSSDRWQCTPPPA